MADVPEQRAERTSVHRDGNGMAITLPNFEPPWAQCLILSLEIFFPFSSKVLPHNLIFLRDPNYLSDDSKWNLSLTGDTLCIFSCWEVIYVEVDKRCIYEIYK